MGRRRANLKDIQAMLNNPEPKRTGSEATRQAHADRLRKLFQYRLYEVIAEVKAPEGVRFATATGNVAIRAWVLRELDPNTKEPILVDGEEVRITLGKTAVHNAYDYGSLVAMPKGLRPRRKPRDYIGDGE